MENVNWPVLLVFAFLAILGLVFPLIGITPWPAVALAAVWVYANTERG